MVGGVLCVPVGACTPPPFFVVLFACFVLLHRGFGVWVWGLCGVVDVDDEFVLVLTITAVHVRFLCVAWTL